MATFTNSNTGETKESKTTGYVLAHPDSDSVLSYLNIPNYLNADVKQSILDAQRKLGFTVRAVTDARVDTTDVTFLEAS